MPKSGGSDLVSASYWTLAEKALQHQWLADARRNRASVAISPTQASHSEAVKQAVDKAVSKADSSARYALTNLQNFKGSRLQEAVRTFIASQLLMEEEKKAIDEVFADLGKLSRLPRSVSSCLVK